MLAVGVGIAPMLQALECLLTTEGDTTQIVFLYGNRTVEDILMRERLDAWAATHRHRFKMVYVVGTRWRDAIIGIRTSNPILPQPPKGLQALNNGITTGVEGWINEEQVKAFAFPPQMTRRSLYAGCLRFTTACAGLGQKRRWHPCRCLPVWATRSRWSSNSETRAQA